MSVREQLAETGKAFYCICFSVRSGSTLLCTDLTQWQLGAPTEYFQLPLRPNVPNLTEYIVKLVAHTPGDRFGFKIAWEQMYLLTKRLRAEGSRDVSFDLRTLFPRIQYIHILRENKLEQAVSSWRATTSDVWHDPVGSRTEAGQPEYDFRAILPHFLQVTAEDWLWRDHFRRLGVEPFIVHYEDYVRNRPASLRQISQFLGADVRPTSLTDHLNVMRDDWTMDIVHRLRDDLEAPRKPYWAGD